jgi:PAS domain S-box-containing protein
MIPQHIWTADRTGYHDFFSRRFYEFTGTTPEESRGDGWLASLHPDDRDRARARWRQSKQTGEHYSIEYRVRRANGEYCWMWSQAVPQQNETGEIVRWIGTLTDISERRERDEERERLLAREREARAEAERRREEVERVTESRTRLMRGFTHDVKNPLGAADGYAQLLQDGILGELSPKQADSIGRIRRSIHASLNLIQDLLELAKAEAGQLELERVRVDAAAIVCEAADDFRAQAGAAGLTLEVHAREPLPAVTDPTRVRQILSNLLSNAVKYTPEGRITVEAAPPTGDSGKIAIRVIDTGPGIPEEKRELIFQEFTRLEPAAQQGAGVGLAISRRIARLLGGDITVESAPGGGSAFTFWLPRGAPDSPRRSE